MRIPIMATVLPPPTAPRLPFGLFLGLRYLRPRRTFVSIITLISVLGVMLGVALPIIVVSVMTGFDHELRAKVLGFDPHIEIVRQGGLMENWRDVRKLALETPGVAPDGAAPYMEGPVLVEANNQRTAAYIRGVNTEMQRHVTDLGALMAQGPGHHAEGKFDLDGDKAVLGVDLARTLGVGVGDTLTIYSPHGLDKLTEEFKGLQGKGADQKKIDELRELVAPQTVQITGLFDSGRYQFDSMFLFVPLHMGQELYELEDKVHGVALRTTDPYHADAVAERLMEKLEPPLVARTWIEKNAQFFDAIHTEVMTMLVIFAVVLVVAAFCVMNTLITITVQKTREIGIMKAVGADVWQVVRVFLAQGVVVGAVGTVGGLGLALGVLALLNPFKNWMEWQFHIEVFSRKVYGLGAIPYWTKPEQAALICLGAFVLCGSSTSRCFRARCTDWARSRIGPSPGGTDLPGSVRAVLAGGADSRVLRGAALLRRCGLIRILQLSVLSQ